MTLAPESLRLINDQYYMGHAFQFGEAKELFGRIWWKSSALQNRRLPYLRRPAMLSSEHRAKDLAEPAGLFQLPNSLYLTSRSRSFITTGSSMSSWFFSSGHRRRGLPMPSFGAMPSIRPAPAGTSRRTTA